jgi:hypothetical protein
MRQGLEQGAVYNTASLIVEQGEALWTQFQPGARCKCSTSAARLPCKMLFCWCSCNVYLHLQGKVEGLESEKAVLEENVAKTRSLMAAMQSELQRVHSEYGVAGSTLQSLLQQASSVSAAASVVGEAPGGLQGGSGSNRVVGRGVAAGAGGWPTPSSRLGVLGGGGAGGGGLSRGLFQTPGSTYSSRR